MKFDFHACGRRARHFVDGSVLCGSAAAEGASGDCFLRVTSSSTLGNKMLADTCNTSIRCLTVCPVSLSVLSSRFLLGSAREWAAAWDTHCVIQRTEFVKRHEHDSSGVIVVWLARSVRIHTSKLEKKNCQTLVITTITLTQAATRRSRDFDE